MNISQSLWPTGETADYQLEDAVIRIERAVSELRYGRPIVVRGSEGSLAALALDAASPAGLERFARAAGDRHTLYLPEPRAVRLGLSTGQGIAVPMADMTFEEASEIAYRRDASAPAIWQPATQSMITAADIAQMALLLPAMICAEVSPQSKAFTACSTLDPMDLPKSRRIGREFDIVARTAVPLRDLGDCEFVVFRGGVAQKDQVAIIVGNPVTATAVPVRIHSSCITGDLCGSLKCDCGDQLRNGLSSLKAQGGGILLYLDQEGRGTGVGAKMRAYGYQHEGLDTIDADAELGFGPDERRYDAAVAMLRALNVESVRLLTNNPTKMAALLEAGIAVNGRVPVTGRVTPDNIHYLRTKTLRAGHMFNLGDLHLPLEPADGE